MIACPSCGDRTRVVEVRTVAPTRSRRRRQCESCGQKLSTLEVVVPYDGARGGKAIDAAVSSGLVVEAQSSQHALVRMLWRSVADDAQCTCSKGDTCPECMAMAALGLGRWRSAPNASQRLAKLAPEAKSS